MSHFYWLISLTGYWGGNSVGLESFGNIKKLKLWSMTFNLMTKSPNVLLIIIFTFKLLLLLELLAVKSENVSVTPCTVANFQNRCWSKWKRGYAASCQHDELQHKKSDMLCGSNTDHVKPVTVEDVQVYLEARYATKYFRALWALMLGNFWKREENRKY